jgi:phenylalanyl-tRNA synthetase alpha chain
MDLEKNIKAIKSIEDLKAVKNKIYGKDGLIFSLQTKLKSAEVADKAKIGNEITQIKAEASRLIDIKLIELEQMQINEKINKDANDIFEYVESNTFIHPLTLITTRMRE